MLSKVMVGLVTISGFLMGFVIGTGFVWLNFYLQIGLAEPLLPWLIVAFILGFGSAAFRSVEKPSAYRPPRKLPLLYKQAAKLAFSVFRFAALGLYWTVLFALAFGVVGFAIFALSEMRIALGHFAEIASPEVLASTIGAVAIILASALSIVAARYFESRQASREGIVTNQREFYQSFLDYLLAIERETLTVEEAQGTLDKLQRGAPLVASTRALRALYPIATALKTSQYRIHDDDEWLELTNNLKDAMRKDIGLSAKSFVAIEELEPHQWRALDPFVIVARPKPRGFFASLRRELE